MRRTLLQRCLTSRHFLTVHDGLVKAFPNCQVLAFTKESKQHAFQADMVCLMDAYDRGQVVSCAQQLQRELLSCELSEVDNVVDVFFNVSQTTVLERRLLLRESMGSSEALFIQLVDDAVLRAADFAQMHFSKILATPDLVPSRGYFAACVLRALHNVGVSNDTDLAMYVCADIETADSPFPREPFDNPFCPGEDLHACPQIRQFLDAVMQTSWFGGFFSSGSQK